MTLDDYTNLTVGPLVDTCNTCTAEFGDEPRGPNGEQPVMDLDHKEGDCAICGHRGRDERTVAHGTREGEQEHLVICVECAEDINCGNALTDLQNYIEG